MGSVDGGARARARRSESGRAQPILELINFKLYQAKREKGRAMRPDLG